ncbi:MAG: hypothetical protein JXR34_12000 [Bacteroidales bacterium]|nr:hypothetical protein [Bacteroidales bacterium]
MKVLIIGLPYFSKYLADKLSKTFPNDTYISLNTYYSKTDKILFIKHLINSDVIHSINGSIRKSIAVLLAVLLRKKVVMHWVGTDLIQAEMEYSIKKTNSTLISKPIHLTDTPWFINRLKKIGIKSPQFIPLKGIEKCNSIPKFPKNFSVLCYIPENRAEFYGIEMAIEIATKLPDITFNWVGISNWKHNLPENVHLHGWVSNISNYINDSVVCLRMPKSDGLSFFVLESLSKGRYVAYNQPFEHSKYCNSIDDFVLYISKKKAEFDTKIIAPDEAKSRIIQEVFDETVVFNQLRNIYL